MLGRERRSRLGGQRKTSKRRGTGDRAVTSSFAILRRVPRLAVVRHERQDALHGSESSDDIWVVGRCQPWGIEDSDERTHEKLY